MRYGERLERLSKESSFFYQSEGSRLWSHVYFTSYKYCVTNIQVYILDTWSTYI